MEIRNLYTPFETELLQLNEYAAKEHKNTFFEMVFILEGTGIQKINQHAMPYSSNKLFLIFPQDTHGFEVTTCTRFFFIRFNHSYLKTQSREWVQKLEYIFHNHNHLPGCILKNMADKPLVRSLTEALLQEQNNEHPHKNEVIQQLINTIITIAARNITLAGATGLPVHLPHNAGMLNYIHQYIYQPEKLKAGAIATFFNISPAYVSEYFKAQTGQGLKQYISSYKLKLIETRLHYTNAQVNDIVAEFGFTDASHLHRFFKKSKGAGPTQYRHTQTKLPPNKQ